MKNIERKITQKIGKNIRNRRNELNISQQELGNYLEVTFQQIQKYENGKNRISPAKLQL